MTICKRLPATASRDEIARKHFAKMERKAKQNGQRSGFFPRVPANLSVRHPDHGCTPAEHEKRKAARTA
jgi:hypothetical protein